MAVYSLLERRRLFAAGRSRTLRIAIAAVFVCSTTHAAPKKRPSSLAKPPPACVNDRRVGAERQAVGELHAAMASLASCAKPVCGASLMQQCASDRAKIEAELPTIIPVALDEDGAPRTDVEVLIDTGREASAADGRPLTIDPGMHEVSFRADSGVGAEQKVALVTSVQVRIELGDRNRPVVVTLPNVRREQAAVVARPVAVEPASPATTSRPGDTAMPDKSTRSVLPYVLGGSGLLAIGAGVLMIHWGRVDNDELARCSPLCRQSSVDHIQRLYIAGDIALGAGVVALGVATVWLLTSGRKESKAPSREAYRVDIKPTSAGAFTSLSGAF